MTLFEKYPLHQLNLANRIVMAPMTRSRATNPDAKANDLIALYYAQRATAGFLISEGIAVSAEAIGYVDIPGIYTPSQIEGWKLVTDKVHRNGGVIFAQLWHVGRVSHPDVLGGSLPLAPSAVNPNIQVYTKNGYVDTLTPLEMTENDIQRTIEDFSKATINALEAGFDGVELHAANGYLFHQFFLKCSNHRVDMYGGSIENRARFLFDVLDRIAENVDLKKVGVRLAPDLDGTFGMFKDEETDQLFEYVINKLNNYNIAYLHISGFVKNKDQQHLRIMEIAKKYRAFYKGHYMINGGFNVQTANQAIESGVADLVSFGLPFISNPDLVARFQQGQALNEVDRSTIYGGGEKGFTDYPALVKKHLK